MRSSTRPSPTEWRPLPGDLAPIAYFLEPEGTSRDAALRAEKARRLKLYDLDPRSPADADTIDLLTGKCRRSIEFFCNNFVWTFDPRAMRYYPMVLFPKQGEYLRFVEACVDEGTDFICEKSRDVGVTNLNGVFAVHRWRFYPGFKTGFCANLQGLVDTLGDPDTIFEKVRMMLRRLPRWLNPPGFDVDQHAMVCRIINPSNGNIITGEGGDNAGRGGRSTAYFLDEAAHIERPDKVNAATSANARSRGWVSSVNVAGDFFDDLRHSGRIPKFTLHWRDDPRKNEAWAIAKKRQIGEATFASEYDIDSQRATPGLVIQKAWIDAAIALREWFPEPPPGPRVAGLDIGAGRDLSVFAPRADWYCFAPESSQDPDTINTAYWALDLAKCFGVELVNFDAPGVGAGPAGVFKRTSLEDGNHVRCVGVNTGDRPNPRRKWPDDRTSEQWFANCRAELWWMARERFTRSYELWLFKTGQQGGHEHHITECFVLEPNQRLQDQLNVQRWFRTTSGKIQMEDKAKMTKSPDDADAFVLSLFEPVREAWSEEHVMFAGTLESASLRF